MGKSEAPVICCLYTHLSIRAGLCGFGFNPELTCGEKRFRPKVIQGQLDLMRIGLITRPDPKCGQHYAKREVSLIAPLNTWIDLFETYLLMLGFFCHCWTHYNVKHELHT